MVNFLQPKTVPFTPQVDDQTNSKIFFLPATATTIKNVLEMVLYFKLYFSKCLEKQSSYSHVLLTSCKSFCASSAFTGRKKDKDGPQSSDAPADGNDIRTISRELSHGQRPLGLQSANMALTPG